MCQEVYMELQRALEIISALADGHNPYTGEIFEKDSVFQNPDTVRALYTAMELLSSRLKSRDRKSRLPQNAGNKWEGEEDLQLAREFDSGMNIQEIAVNHGRTMPSIRQRLIKMGKIQY